MAKTKCLSLKEILKIPENRREGRLFPAIKCKDGVLVSVQYSHRHYSSPDVFGEPKEVEVKVYPKNRRPKGWQYEGGIHPYIPIEDVEKFIEKHGGMGCVKRSDVESRLPTNQEDRLQLRMAEQHAKGTPERRKHEMLAEAYRGV